MTGSITLDVIIAMVFVYLIYSLLVTILGEMISTWLGIRARNLRMMLERMLNDEGVEPQGKIAKFFLYESEYFKNSLAGRFYNHPSIKYSSESKKENRFFFTHGKPSYISDSQFADTIVQLFRNKGIGADDLEKIQYAIRFNTLHIQPETLLHFKNLLVDADNNIARFKEVLKGWYNETNDRATGWFKRKMQFILFWIGFLLAYSFNVDTISMVSKLSTDVNARRDLVQMAIAASDSNSTFAKITDDTKSKVSLPDSAAKEVKKSIQQANQALGLGWADVKPFHTFDCGSIIPKIYPQFVPWCREFWGLMLTALALSLGAPFWFDLLKKLVAIRGVGIKPEEKKAEEKPNAVVPQPTLMPPPKPAPSLIETEIEAVKAALKGVVGVVDVVEGFIKVAGKKQSAIQILIIGGTDIGTIKPHIINLNIEHEVEYTETGRATTHEAQPGATIKNKTEVNGKGSLGCFFTRRDTNKYYLASCWHVLKGNTDWYEQTGEKSVLDNANKPLGIVVDGTLTQHFDAGFAELIDVKKPSNTKAGIKKNFRPVTINDAFDETVVSFKGKTAVIFNNRLSKEIEYADGCTRELKDLFSLTKYENGNRTAPSVAGDSGAVVVDKAGYPLGMVVGGDGEFTYVVKFSNIISSDSIYDEYSVITT